MDITPADFVEKIDDIIDPDDGNIVVGISDVIDAMLEKLRRIQKFEKNNSIHSDWEDAFDHAIDSIWTYAFYDSYENGEDENERTEEIFNCAAEKTFYYCHEFHDLDYIFRYNEKFKTDWREYTDSDQRIFLNHMSYQVDSNSYSKKFEEKVSKLRKDLIKTSQTKK